MKVLELARQLGERRLIREGGWVAAGQGIAIVARIGGLRLITDLVSPQVYGEVVLLLGLASLGSNMFCLPVLSALVRFYPDAARAGRVAALRALLRQLLVPRTLGIAALLAVGGVVWVGFGPGRASGVAFVGAAILLVLDVARLFESTLLNAARRQRAYSLWYAADAVSRPALAVAAILALGADALSVLIGYAAAVACTNLAFRRASVRGGPGEVAAPGTWLEETRRSMLRYAGPLVPLALLGWIISLSDRYILAGLTSPTQTGIYAAAYGLASTPFIMLDQLLALTLRPVYFDAVGQQDRRRERRTFLVWMAALAVSLLLGMALVVALAGPIVKLVLGEAYWSAAELVPWIAAAYAIQAVQHLFEHTILALQQTRRLLVVHAAGAVTAVSFYFVLIPRLGARGAALATLLSMLASCTASMLLSGALPRLFARDPRMRALSPP